MKVNGSSSLQELLLGLNSELNEIDAEITKIQSLPCKVDDAIAAVARETAEARRRFEHFFGGFVTADASEIRLWSTLYSMPIDVRFNLLLDYTIVALGEQGQKNVHDAIRAAWPAETISDNDRAERLKSLHAKRRGLEIKRKELFVSQEVSGATPAWPTNSDPEIILEFAGGRFNRERFRRIREAVQSSSDAERRLNERIAPRLRRIQDLKSMLNQAGASVSNIDRAEYQDEIAELQAQVTTLRADVQRIMAVRGQQNAVFGKCAEFLRSQNVNIDDALI
jgi:hypothetical protein